MIGIYLSGTGNTKHCIEKLVGLIDNSAKVFPLEMPNLIEEIKKSDTIIWDTRHNIQMHLIW